VSSVKEEWRMLKYSGGEWDLKLIDGVCWFDDTNKIIIKFMNGDLKKMTFTSADEYKKIHKEWRETMQVYAITEDLMGNHTKTG